MFWTIIKFIFYIGIILLAIFWWLPDVEKYINVKQIFGTIWDSIKSGFKSL